MRLNTKSTGGGKKKKEVTSELRFGRLVALVLLIVISFRVDSIAEKSFAALSSESESLSFSSANQKYEEVVETTEFNDEMLQKVKASRRSRRPYGRYCSTEVINEQQLWPGARKKLISFSLFRSAQKAGKRPFESYLNGLKANVIGAASYYPDWIVRVFTLDLTDEQIQELIQVDPTRVEVVICHPSSTSSGNDDNDNHNSNSNPLGHGDYSIKAATRFFASDDPSVWAVISRDSDSRFSPRELMAVNEWLAADDQKYCFHVMHDHLYHLGVPILAGAHGIKRGCLDNNSTITSLMDTLIDKDRPTDYGNIVSFDQYFLKEYLWSTVKSRTMDHNFHLGACSGSGVAICQPFSLGSIDGSGPRDSKKEYYIGQTMRSDKDMASPGYACTLECQPAASNQEG